MNYHFAHDITRGTVIIFAMIAAPFLFLISCNTEKKEFVDIEFDKESSYTMRTTDALTFISDSGFSRIKLEAKEWLVFGEATEPYQYFPEKFHGELLDTLSQVVARFDADTAYNFTKKKLWKLIGNVVAVNQEGEKFETSLLFWDEGEEKIYSDQFIRITRGDFIQTGSGGFESNQTLTRYRIFNATAEIPVQEIEPADTTDTLDIPLHPPEGDS